jgi:hypothetical protein
MNGNPWTSGELNRLRALYPIRSTRKVAELLKRSVFNIYGAAATFGLRKTEEYLQSPEACRLRRGTGQSHPGFATQFRKGQVPANKGLRRPGYSRGRMKETQFRKGQRSGIAAKNWKPIGTVLADPAGYLRIKVREAVYGAEPTGFGNVRVWPLLQRHVWEQHHGPIPTSHVIALKDHNRQNCVIENLECISRADLARRNVMWNRFPRELAEAIQLNGAIKRKLGRLQK